MHTGSRMCLRQRLFRFLPPDSLFRGNVSNRPGLVVHKKGKGKGAHPSISTVGHLRRHWHPSNCLVLPENHQGNGCQATRFPRVPAASPPLQARALGQLLHPLLTCSTHKWAGWLRTLRLIAVATGNIFSAKSLLAIASGHEKSILESIFFLLHCLMETEVKASGSPATVPFSHNPSP